MLFARAIYYEYNTTVRYKEQLTGVLRVHPVVHCTVM